MYIAAKSFVTKRTEVNIKYLALCKAFCSVLLFIVYVHYSCRKFVINRLKIALQFLDSEQRKMTGPGRVQKK